MSEKYTPIIYPRTSGETSAELKAALDDPQTVYDLEQLARNDPLDHVPIERRLHFRYRHTARDDKAEEASEAAWENHDASK